LRCLLLRQKKKNIFYLFMKWLHGEKEKKALLITTRVRLGSIAAPMAWDRVCSTAAMSWDQRRNLMRQAGGCTAESIPPSNTGVGPQGLLGRIGRSWCTSFPIELPARFARVCTLLAKQTLALCALGVQPKMRPCVYSCKQSEQRGLARFYLRWSKRRGWF